MVHTHHAVAIGTDEACGADAARASVAAPQLVSRPRHNFRWRRGGIQQQSETDHQKSVWLSNVRSDRNCVVSSTWQLTRARIRPQILVRRPLFSGRLPCGRFSALTLRSVCVWRDAAAEAKLQNQPLNFIPELRPRHLASPIWPAFPKRNQPTSIAKSPPTAQPSIPKRTTISSI